MTQRARSVCSGPFAFFRFILLLRVLRLRGLPVPDLRGRHVGIGPHGVQLGLGGLGLHAVHLPCHEAPGNEDAERHERQLLQHLGNGLLGDLGVKKDLADCLKRIREGDLKLPHEAAPDDYRRFPSEGQEFEKNT